MGSLRKDALTPALSPWERGQTANALSLRERVRVRGYLTSLTADWY
jgi:hypothetical protein